MKSVSYSENPNFSFLEMCNVFEFLDIFDDTVHQKYSKNLTKNEEKPCSTCFTPIFLHGTAYS